MSVADRYVHPGRAILTAIGAPRGRMIQTTASPELARHALDEIVADATRVFAEAVLAARSLEEAHAAARAALQEVPNA